MSRHLEIVPAGDEVYTRYRRVFMRAGHGKQAPSKNPVPHVSPAPVEVFLGGPEGQAIWEIGRPWDHDVLVYDVETVDGRTDQPVRIGCYLLAGIHPDRRMELARSGRLTREALDRIREVGFFNNPHHVSPDEVETMRNFAAIDPFRRLLGDPSGRLGGPPARVMTSEEFVTGVFYPWVHKERALAVAHNAPFDFGALAESWITGRWFVPGEELADGSRTEGTNNEGVTLRLCSCPKAETGMCLTHPAIMIQHVGQALNFIRFQHTKHPPARPSGRGWTDTFEGHFLDTITLGKALRAGKGGLSLEKLCQTFGVPYRKPPHDFAGPVNEGLLAYVFGDVLATWQLFRKERGEYRRYHLSRPIDKIYSPASISKAMLDEMGVPFFMKKHDEEARRID